MTIFNNTSAQKASVLLFEPGQYPKTVAIDSKPSGLVKAIGGDFETFYPFGNDICVVCRADGYEVGLPVNRAIRDPGNEILEVMYGPFLICDGSDKRIKSLSDFDRHTLSDKYQYPESFKEVGGKIELAAYRPQRSREER